MNVLKEVMDANISVLILTEVIAVNVSPVTQKAAKNVLQQCRINGTCYPYGTINPNNPCQVKLLNLLNSL